MYIKAVTYDERSLLFCLFLHPRNELRRVSTRQGLYLMHEVLLRLLWTEFVQWCTSAQIDDLSVYVFFTS